MNISKSVALALVAVVGAFCSSSAWAASDNGIPVDQAKYVNRAMLPDFTAPDCPDNPRALTQVKGNLYRHTTGAGLAVHSGLVLITEEGALVIDPAMTCTAGWLRTRSASASTSASNMSSTPTPIPIISAARRCCKRTARPSLPTCARLSRLR